MSHPNLDNSFIFASNIQTIVVDVTEEINKAFIKEFITTNLEINNIILDNNTYVAYSFICNLKLYEIYIVKTSYDKPIIAPEIFSTLYIKSHTQATTDLFILKDFFVLYKNKKLYSFKTIQESSKTKDIKAYVVQTYNLTIDNIYTIDDEKFEQLKFLYIKNIISIKIKSFNKFNKNKSFFFFNIFTFIFIMIFISFIYMSYITNTQKLNDQLDNIKIQYKQLKQDSNTTILNNQKISLKLIKLFKYIKLENLTTQKITYQNNKVQLALLHKDKNKLLNIVTIYNNKLMIKKIKFLKEQKLYTMVITIDI